MRYIWVKRMGKSSSEEDGGFPEEMEQHEKRHRDKKGNGLCRVTDLTEESCLLTADLVHGQCTVVSAKSCNQGFRPSVYLDP